MEQTMIAAWLAEQGYRTSPRAWEIIRACDDWYRARETQYHRRVNVNGCAYTVPRIGFARRLAGDDANLCELIEINGGGNSAAQFERLNELLADNRFQSEYRRQLELVAAEGTAAAYVWLEDAQGYTDGTLRGGRIRIAYVDALGFFPLTVENGEVIEAAFAGESYTGGKIEYTVTICRHTGGAYVYDVARLDQRGQEIPGSRRVCTLGAVKPFAVLRTANVNTFDDMQGYGYPKMYDQIPLLAALDMAFEGLSSDIETSEKLTLINERLCQFDDTGRPILPNEQMKRRFVMLGEKLPDEKDVIHDVSPAIRIDAFKATIELILQLLGQNFGFGTKKYALDGASQAIVTATQYIGERQDMMQELNRQRFQAKQYICGIIRAALWFSNTFCGTAYDLDEEIRIEFDDAYIEGKTERLEGMRQDALAGLGGVQVRARYLAEKYNLEEDEALAWAQSADEDYAEGSENDFPTVQNILRRR